MKIVRRFVIAWGVLLLGFLVQPLNAQSASHIMLSEVSPMHGSSTQFNTGEFVELYNPFSYDVTFGANVALISGNTPAGTNAAEWQVSLSGKTIKAFGFYLIGDGGVAGADVSFPSSKNLSNSGIRSCVQLRDGTTILDAFAWDASTTLSGEGTHFTPSSTSSDGKSFERKSSATATGPDALGNAYDTGNNATDFFENTAANANPQNSSSPIEVNPFKTSGDGSGKATINPSVVGKNATVSFSMLFTGLGIDSVTFFLPVQFSWSNNILNVTSTVGSVSRGTESLVGDTLCFGGLNLGSADTLVVTVVNVTAPDSSGNFSFIVKSAAVGGTPVAIPTLPVVSVYGITPIVDLHINNSQGVPVAPYQVGATVTVSGIITADFNSTYTNIFVQDATGGVCVYRQFRSFNYQVGDSVTVTGTITQFRGLIEISLDTTTYVVHSHGNPLPEPLLLTAHDVNETFNTDDFTELNEGRLVRLNGVTYNASANTITDSTGTTGTYITSTPPSATFDLIGILKQYIPGTPVPGPPYTGSYEVDPRTLADIIALPGPVLTSTPYEIQTGQNFAVIDVRTSTPSKAVVKYGLTAAYTDSVTSQPDTVHEVTLSNLATSTVYHYQVTVSDTSGANTTGDAMFITGSTSSDSIGVFFNKKVSYSVAQPESAQEQVDMSKVLLYRISQAQHSIDMCAYSFSGTVGANIATALLAKHNQGVRIRVIGEHDNITTAPWNTLKNAGIVVIDDTYDLIDAGAGLMHNKFYVIDHRDTSSSRVDWVVTGSWNATDPGTNDDAQNMIEIQDRSLAEAYTLEFNEMWGSSGDSPNQAASRFGLDKTDITPHHFTIAGFPMELYFSPSDKTTSKINAALNAATSSINICMYTFTRDDLAATLIAKKNAGKKVHVVMDNNTDTGNEFSTLKNAGVDVLLKNLSPSPSSALLHHKYAVIDADKPSPNNMVLTGSHNWSSAAETQNDENELIIHSQLIANLYLQEFKQRYVDAGGIDDIVLSVKSFTDDTPTKYGLEQNYPNPFNPSTRIQFSIVDVRSVSVKVYDILGREVATLVNEKMNPGVYTISWNAARFSSGIYFVRLQTGNFSAVRKVVLMK
ncbi:MAG: phospholipase D-like domain-containing protein [Bacteroidota bacterium]